MRSKGFTLFAVLTALLFTVSVSEAKGPPEGKGGGRPEDKATALQKGVETEADDAKEKAKEKAEELRRTADNMPKGLEKQKAKKSEQVQKELDKGSEKGKEMRQEHSRKWWKFWGNNEPAEPESTE